MLEGHSGSQLNRVGNIVTKESSYLANCADSQARKQFLIAFGACFQYAPKVLEIHENTIKYEFIEGKPSFEEVDLKELGVIIRTLHSLKMAAPKKETNLDWLKKMAEKNLAHHNIQLDLDSLIAEISTEAEVIVHGEPADLIIGINGKITILDWDEAGMGSRYQDIGYILFKCRELRRGEIDFKEFLVGYNDADVDPKKMKKTAGLIALAYSHWANTDFRLKLGLQLVNEM